MRRTRGSGCGAEELEGAGLDAAGERPRAATRRTGRPGPCRGARRRGRRGRGRGTGRRPPATVGVEPGARRRRPRARSTVASTGIDVGLHLADPRVGASSPPRRRRASTAAFTGWVSSVGVGGREHHAARADHPGAPRPARPRGRARGCRRTPRRPPRTSRDASGSRRASATTAGGRWRWSTREHPGGQVERDRAAAGPRDGAAGGAGAGADVGDAARPASGDG